MKEVNYMFDELMNYNNLYTIEERKNLIKDSLKTLRQSKGLKQTEVAELLGINYQTYCNYESGRCEPPAEYIVRLSKLYSVPTDFILQTDNYSKNDESQKKILDMYNEQIEELKKQIQNGSPEAQYALGLIVAEIQKLIAAINNK